MARGRLRQGSRTDARTNFDPVLPKVLVAELKPLREEWKSAARTLAAPISHGSRLNIVTFQRHWQA